MAFNLNGFNFNQSIQAADGRVINTWADILNRAGLGMEVMHERNAHNLSTRSGCSRKRTCRTDCTCNRLIQTLNFNDQQNRPYHPCGVLFAVPAIAGPYVNVETSSKFVGTDYSKSATDFFVGYEGEVGALDYFIEGGPSVTTPDNGVSETVPAGKVGFSVSKQTSTLKFMARSLPA